MEATPTVSKAMVVYLPRLVTPSRLNLKTTISSDATAAYRPVAPEQRMKKRGRPKKYRPYGVAEAAVWKSEDRDVVMTEVKSEYNVEVAVASSEDHEVDGERLDASGAQKPEVISPVMVMPTSLTAASSEKDCKDGSGVRKPPVSSPTVHMNLNMSMSMSMNSGGLADYFNVNVPKTTKKTRKNARTYYYGTSEMNTTSTAPSPVTGFEDGRFASGDVPVTNIASGLGEIGITPYVLDVKPGENILEKVGCFSQPGHSGCILSAHGIVSQAMLHRATVAGGTVIYEGRFHIVLLTGTFQPSEDTEDLPREIPELKVSLAGLDYRVFGGRVAGPLIAATPVQVVVGSFIGEEPE